MLPNRLFVTINPRPLPLKSTIAFWAISVFFQKLTEESGPIFAQFSHPVHMLVSSRRKKLITTYPTPKCQLDGWHVKTIIFQIAPRV
jgi:hypothetical protein